MEKREFSRAEAILVENIYKTSEPWELLQAVAGVFFMDGKYLNSAVALKKAEALKGLDERSRFTLAMAYVALGQRDWARPELEKLAKAGPSNPLYLYWLSRLDYDQQLYLAAVAKLERAIELDAGFMKAYDNLGLCYEALGEFDAATRNYRKAVELNRTSPVRSPWPSFNFAAMLVKLGRYDEAIPYLRESLRYDPRFPKAHYQLGVMHEKQGNDQEAINELAQASAFDPAYAQPHYAMARIYRRKGDRVKSELELAHFERLKKLERRDVN